jgi:hypothetical protein
LGTALEACCRLQADYSETEPEPEQKASGSDSKLLQFYYSAWFQWMAVERAKMCKPLADKEKVRIVWTI